MTNMGNSRLQSLGQSYRYVTQIIEFDPIF